MATNDATGQDYTFLVGWILLFLFVAVVAKTSRVGYVIVYYGLLLMILFIVVAEYRQIAPLLNPPTIGQLNQ